MVTWIPGSESVAEAGKVLWRAIGGVALSVAAVTLAAAAPAPPQAATCAACHGVDGLGNASAGYPSLAGLSAAYLEQQLHGFKHGTRENVVMTAIAKGLNGADRKALATYYAGLKLPVKAEPAPLPGGPGAVLALDGAWGRATTGLPSCESCHGPDGVGVGAVFPRLAGQPANYLAAQLKDWQAGSRKNDPLHLMRNVARKLNPAQITAVAAYYAALSPNPPAPPSAKGGK
jgi:cytochrome c553